MSVENANTFDELIATIPTGNDNLDEGDNHIRLLKHVLKFVMAGTGGIGFDEAIVTTEAEMDYLVGVASNIQAQLNDIQSGEVPVGGIVAYYGVFGNIPTRYRLCDGANGTPNLVDKFVLDAQNDGQMGSTGGNKDQTIVNHSHTANHTHSTSTTAVANHTHTLELREALSNPNNPVTKDGATNANYAVDAAGSHTHSPTIGSTQITVQSGASGTNKNLPPYYKLAFIMRVS